jgi:hypothetical protein
MMKWRSTATGEEYKRERGSGSEVQQQGLEDVPSLLETQKGRDTPMLQKPGLFVL